MNEQQTDCPASIISALGIRFLPSEQHEVRATMPVDERTRQPFGILSGGAALALAETAAGYGSLLLCDEGFIPVGMQVCANHVASAAMGKTVTAIGTILHKGRTTHVWNIDIVDGSGKLISTARVTNQILSRRD